MRVRFLQDYQGQWTGPHFYRVGCEYDFDAAVGALLVGDGRAVEVAPPAAPAEPQPAKRGRKGASDGGVL